MKNSMQPAKREDLIDSRILNILLYKLTNLGESLTQNKVPEGYDNTDIRYNYGVGRGIIATCARIQKAIEDNEMNIDAAINKDELKIDTSYKDNSSRKITILDEAE